MTDTLDELHAQVALAALAANANILHVYDATVSNPTPDPPYVLVYTSINRPYGTNGAGNALDSTSRTFVVRIKCKCAGLTAEAARVVAMQVRTSLLDLRPVIAGRVCGPMHADADATPPERDDSTNRVVMVQDLDYVFTSTG